MAAATAWLVGVDRGQGKVLFLIVSLLLAGIGSAGALHLGMSTAKLTDIAPPLPDTSRHVIHERPCTLRALLRSGSDC